jgi:hypothetical protein
MGNDTPQSNYGNFSEYHFLFCLSNCHTFPSRFGYYIRKKQREQNAFFQQFHETQQREEEFVPYEEVIDNRLDDSTNQTTFEPNKEKKRNHL